MCRRQVAIDSNAVQGMVVPGVTGLLAYSYSTG